MTILHIAMIAAGVVCMLVAGLVAAAHIVDGAIRVLADSIAEDGRRNRELRSNLAAEDYKLRAAAARERQTLLPPPPVFDGTMTGRGTQRSR